MLTVGGKNVRRRLLWPENNLLGVDEMKTSKPNEFINRGKVAMTKWLGRINTFICLICMAALFQAQANAATLDDISYSSLPGDRVQVDLKLSEPLQGEPLNFTIDNPARIVLDFPDTSLNLGNKNQSIGVGAAHSISAVEAAGRTRVVLNLVKPVGYEMAVQGNNVVLTLAAAAGTTSSSSSCGMWPGVLSTT